VDIVAIIAKYFWSIYQQFKKKCHHDKIRLSNLSAKILKVDFAETILKTIETFILFSIKKVKNVILVYFSGMMKKSWIEKDSKTIDKSVYNIIISYNIVIFWFFHNITLANYVIFVSLANSIFLTLNFIIFWLDEDVRLTIRFIWVLIIDCIFRFN